MSFFLINAGDQSLGSKSPLIKKHDRQNFSDAIALLSHASALKAKTEITYTSEAERGYADGLAAGRRAIEAQFLTEIQKWSEAIDANETARREEIATVAFAAAQAIVGAIDRTEAVRGIVDQVIKRSETGQAFTVHLHPENCDALRQLGGFPESVEFVPNINLGPTDCEIVTVNGKIIAGIDLQFAALAKRWAINAPTANDAGDGA
jgi:flagellar biosynthesis/type III secretory pathway protein FliH